MKTFLRKACLFALCIVGFTACKKEVYPEELQFLVIDSYTKKPIESAKVELYKVWKHAYKMGNNAKKDAMFADYGRKEAYELQSGFTDKNGKINFTQEQHKYLYIIPAVQVEGYEFRRIDTLRKFSKKNADDVVYTFELEPTIKTTFIFKSFTTGFRNDSVVFASNSKVTVMKGATIDEKIEVYTSDSSDENKIDVWFTAKIYRNGKQQTLCGSVISFPHKKNEFVINVDL